MALLISRRIVRSFGSFSALRRFGSLTSTSHSCQASDSIGHISGNNLRHTEWFSITKGTHSTKTISDVSGTGRKPCPQKGTGRARHGTKCGPQFRGGATMHGPKPRGHAIKLNKKVRCLGLKIALFAGAAEGKLSHYLLGLNVYIILLHDTLVISHDAVKRIVEQMHTPIRP